MDDAKRLCSEWQSLLENFRAGFTLGGWARFAQWATGTVLCCEEHTITQILTGLGLEDQWRNVECFAEYGAWDRQRVERQLMRVVEQEHPARWGGYHPVAIDDTKEHRSSADVWGTCTFHESGARSPNRATTVRAHNWVVMGDLAPGKPWTYLPTASRLYFRKTQLPTGERFQTKTAMAVEMLREADAESAVPILAAFDGAYAMETVIKPCLNPPVGTRRIEFVTRLRKDARLYEPLETTTKNRKGGRPRKWGKRLPSPQEHAKWGVPWQRGRAYVYGKIRTFRYKCLRCCWAVSGPKQIMLAFVFEVPGYDKLWATITSAADLSASQTLSANAGRFRQEDGFRDHKQRLGMEECRAWTKEPVLRTFQIQMTVLTLLRLMQFRLARRLGEAWCPAPPWNLGKHHVSILDLRRLFSKHRARFSQVMFALNDLEKPPQTKYPCGQPTSRAA
jgi:DDE superfamily endonuclease